MEEVSKTASNDFDYVNIQTRLHRTLEQRVHRDGGHSADVSGAQIVRSR